MRKAIVFSMLVVCLFALQPALSTNAASTENTNFTKAINEKLKEEVNYFDNGSVHVVDSITKEAEITKVISTDDPNTEENEEELEVYKANVVVGSVDYKLKRDNLFYLQKHDFYFYDVDNQEFLKLSNFMDDQEIQSLYEDYMKNLEGGEITLGSNLLASFFIFLSVVIAPLLIMSFHNKSIPTPMVRKNSVY